MGQTSAMSSKDLREAMQLSRTVDLYYNSEVWQNVMRKLMSAYQDFLAYFTGHLKEMMVLDSPVSLERRGVIIYEYCREHYPEMLPEVSVAWIQAGFSLKKELAGNVVKIKHPEAFLNENKLELEPIYGEPTPTHRYYLFSADGRRILFGYDTETHQPEPVCRIDLMQKQ